MHRIIINYTPFLCQTCSLPLIGPLRVLGKHVISSTARALWWKSLKIIGLCFLHITQTNMLRWMCWRRMKSFSLPTQFFNKQQLKSLPLPCGFSVLHLSLPLCYYICKFPSFESHNLPFTKPTIQQLPWWEYTSFTTLALWLDIGECNITCLFLPSMRWKIASFLYVTGAAGVELAALLPSCCLAVIFSKSVSLFLNDFLGFGPEKSFYQAAVHFESM